TNIELDNYNDILENMTGQKYDKIYESFKNKKFYFDDYIMIIVHKSAFNGDTREIIYNIENECKNRAIPLVLFSGGITANYYEEEKNFKKLELNSKDFYSQNLQLFLDNYRKNGKIELLMLSYGKMWKLDIVLNCIEKINIFIETHKDEEDIVYQEFVNHTDFHLLESLEIKYPKPNIENGWIYLSELEKIRLSIELYIKESITYEK
ncbi:MAG: hypothetical protein KAU90_09005, partial [Sulfurovaceae bacterium]|nr:hypothetical protein [Sulfurovaceae bacterium]